MVIDIEKTRRWLMAERDDGMLGVISAKSGVAEHALREFCEGEDVAGNELEAISPYVAD